MTGGGRGIRLHTWLLVALVVATNPLGNVALSRGARQQTASTGPAWLLEKLANPWILLGILLLVLWTLSRMALLGRADLSWVLPVTSLGYVLSVALAGLVLGEQVGGVRWAGTLLIVAGTALVGQTEPNTTAPASPRSESR